MTGLATAAVALTITVWPSGLSGPHERWTVRCNPTGGTHPARVAGCRRLNALSDPFRPIPKNTLCTQLYGGPEVARIVGTFKGKRIWAEFRRRDGCEIGRWERLRPLLPSGDA